MNSPVRVEKPRGHTTNSHTRKNFIA